MAEKVLLIVFLQCVVNGWKYCVVDCMCFTSYVLLQLEEG